MVAVQQALTRLKEKCGSDAQIGQTVQVGREKLPEYRDGSHRDLQVLLGFDRIFKEAGMAVSLGLGVDLAEARFAAIEARLDNLELRSMAEPVSSGPDQVREIYERIAQAALSGLAEASAKEQPAKGAGRGRRRADAG